VRNSSLGTGVCVYMCVSVWKGETCEELFTGNRCVCVYVECVEGGDL